MSTRLKAISKTAFVKGTICKKAFWLDRRGDPSLRNEMQDDWVREYRLREGNRVGELARQIFDNEGVLIGVSSQQKDQAQAATQAALQQGAGLLYEGFFTTPEGYEVRPDILRKVNPAGPPTYDLLEVKSSTQVKDEHIPDIAFQKWVLEKCGLRISSCSIVHLNSDYVLKDSLRPQDLFLTVPVDARVAEYLPSIPALVQELQRVLALESAPSLPVGRQCSKPYACEYQSLCWKNISIGSVHHLNRVTQKKLDLYSSQKIETLDQINEEDTEGLTPLQTLQRQSWIEKAPIIKRERIREFVQSLHSPITHLDFETLGPAIPTVRGMKPYGQYPFQFSLHIEEESGALTHHEVLSEDPDPRRWIAEELVRLLPKKGSVLAYHASFERTHIQLLAEIFPDLAPSLQSIIQRMEDLEKPFSSGDYVDYRFEGSTSIKKVLPVLCRHLSYEDLEVSNGTMAQIAYLQLLTETNPAEKDRIRKSLLEYCKRDTQAMVEVLANLKSAVALQRAL